MLGKQTVDLITLLWFLEGNVDSRLKQDLAEQSIDKVDYVVCNLYPFKVKNDFSMYYVRNGGAEIPEGNYRKDQCHNP